MNNRFVIIMVLLLLLLLLFMTCRDASKRPDITPTLAISETPSITPMPPTATPTLVNVASVTVSPLPAGETAVIPSSPTLAAVSPTFTPTPAPIVPTRTPTPTPTATDEGLLIKPGVTYWHTAKDKYGRFECWQMLKARNGWHERRLPIGETMRLPGVC